MSALRRCLVLVFLGVKAYEYNAKFEHDILPGHIGELLAGMGLTREQPVPLRRHAVRRARAGQLSSMSRKKPARHPPS